MGTFLSWVNVCRAGFMQLQVRSSRVVSALPALLALIALCLWLAVKIVTLSLADYAAGYNEEAAVSLDSGQSLPRVILAERAYIADPSRQAETMDSARAALEANPYTAGALTLLGLVAQQRGDAAASLGLMNLALRVDLRNLRAELSVLAQNVAQGNTEAALRRIDTLLRAGAGSPPLKEALAQILTSEPYRAGFVNLLRSRPVWRLDTLTWLAVATKNPVGLAAVYSELQDGVNPPDPAELQAILIRLTNNGLYGPAYAIWKKSVGVPALANLLYNGRFENGLSNQPFDWVYAHQPATTIEIVGQGETVQLNMHFFGGRVGPELLSHMLALTPGRYRLTGQLMATALQNERGLRWRLFCLGKPGADLAATEFVNGDAPWRGFSLAFAAPATDCNYQKLVLELPARYALESVITGGVDFRNMEIKPD